MNITYLTEKLDEIKKDQKKNYILYLGMNMNDETEKLNEGKKDEKK